MAKKKVKAKPDLAMKNEKEFVGNILENNITNQTLFLGQWGAGTGQPSVMLSQADTLFKNNRWYLVSNMRQLLSEIYVELGLVETLVDVPVNDALRGDIKFKSDQLSEDELNELELVMDREGDINAASYSEKWKRLFGGAGVLIMTDQDPATPMDIERIAKGGKLEFRDVDMWELFWSLQNVPDMALGISDPSIMDPEFYDYYGVKVHKSRVLKCVGKKAPSFIRPRLRGWGVSIVETLVRSINQYLKATDLSFEVLDEFKLDIFKVKNLTNTLLMPNGANSVKERIQLANYQKNYQHALTMDAEDDYVQKQLSFSGLAEAMQGIRMQIASDMRMPLTKVFGISAAGFSSGEDDIENYNQMVEQIRRGLKWHLLRMGEIRCQNLFGMIPDDLEIEFKPLRILSAEQEENVKTQKFARVLQAKQAGELDTREFREMCNADDLLPMKLDVTDAAIDEIDTAKEEAAASAAPNAQGGKAPKSTTQAKEAPEAKT